MIWALLAFLGVPLWLMVAALAAVVLSRRKLKNEPGVFPVVLRAEGAEKWPRSVGYCLVVRDVIVLYSGVTLMSTEVLAIDDISELEIGDGPKKPAGAVGRLVAFADGSRREIAVAKDDAARLSAGVAGS